MTAVLVEHHWESPLTDADMNAIIACTASCFGLHRVDRNLSLLSADGREVFCHFTAPDAESVRIALRQACVPPGHAWSGTVHDAPGLTDERFAQANILVSRKVDAPVALEEIHALDDFGVNRFLTHRVSRIPDVSFDQSPADGLPLSRTRRRVRAPRAARGKDPG